MQLSSVLASTFALALLLPLGSASAQAGTGGFRAGDLYLLSGGLETISGPPGIVHIDPGTGQKDRLLTLTVGGQGRGGICYEPFRDRLMFWGGFTLNHAELYLSDAAGNVQSLGFGQAAGPTFTALTPRGDGLVYCVWYGSSLISYLDAAGAIHSLKDASGTTPYMDLLAGAVYAMEYDAATNQLVIAQYFNDSVCPNEIFDSMNVHFLQLSADGTSVLSEACANYESVPGVQIERCESVSQGPNGDLIMITSSEGSTAGNRVARIDPVAHTVVPYASNSYFGAGLVRGGTYSHVLGKALLHDPINDVLRAYGQGDSGTGTVIASGGMSIPGTSSEPATLIEVAPSVSLSGLTANTSQVSLTTGGTQTLSIDFGVAQAGAIYLVLGSATGWAPGLTAGTQHLPLNVDNYLLYTLFTPNSVPLGSSLGFLDGVGRGTTTFTLPASSDPSLAGAVLHHAASALDFNFVTQRTSNPVPVALVP